ncbi:ABC transporter-like protein [Parathielavia hyrcaniae]|uniref:ABC transporter-like protein n=1 Tax=Parathielavia hyrcaniae TaxID=113614 RepID=A0AAN6Q3L7_9PEZI|nr:ABC transporter-like protein [Parathielavia hyrcaniae]
MQQEKQESPSRQAAVNGTSSGAGSSRHGNSSETVENPDLYQIRTAHSLDCTLQGGVSTELRRIATALSKHQSRATTGAETFNPDSSHFDATEWARSFVGQLNTPGQEASELGVLFRDLDVFGSGFALQLQETVGSVLLAPLRIGELFSRQQKHKHILHGFNGLLKGGDLLAVLGRPGSGCSTFLKSICQELHGLTLGQATKMHYNGVSPSQMSKEFKGEVVYNQEVEKHFPHLTVGQTLEFAAAMRAPSQRIDNMSRSEYCKYVARVVMALLGLSHTYHTKVGNECVRGVSGGERKRVSIAEMMVAGSPICAWDNSTRGLDSANALNFVEALRISCDVGRHAHAVAIYQASEAIYGVFDKATVLYDGRQIYFGPARAAKDFFERQGWCCPPRQSTADFLTSVTNPQERTPRLGMEAKVPRTPQDFERYWLHSPEFKALQDEMARYDAEFEGDGRAQSIERLRQGKNQRQARGVRPGSPYTISVPMQVRLNTKRAYQRVWNDLMGTATIIGVTIIFGMIIGSIYYGNPDATAGFDGKGAILFMAVLVNALVAIAEIEGLYAQRAIVEKHASYAFYHPFTEAAAGIMADIPVKFASTLAFNSVVYFLAGLSREPGRIFVFFLVSYISTFVMIATFRTMAAVSRTVVQALALAAVLMLALIIYTGYIITVPRMHPWLGWIRWINPVYYAFEMLIANEFHGREFPCSLIVPPYSPPVGDSWVCASLGAVAGRATVNGDAYIEAMYGYTYSHVRRNFGILMAFLVGYMALYFAAAEFNSARLSIPEVLVFPRGHIPAYLDPKRKRGDEEASEATATAAERRPQDDKNANMEPQKDVFTWKDVVYDIDVREGKRRLLDHVSGWVKPGTLTALMGASGAGKTTLLDVLAHRTGVGVVTGDMLVNGTPLRADFQRQTGYVQQQDLHLDTATVRESLRFSAMLRRPKSVSKREKLEFVEEVITMLGMEEFANAVVGIPGEGLNIEQRKLLTIGVELVAKPKLLLFLDEPTSGLDSQSAWTICVFLRKLADAGQAVLCTIHQPNAVLFQQFDRLLLLAEGGKTVYFGDIGKNSQTLLGYFERNGSRPCGDDENPAEFMLEVVADGVNRDGEDWHSLWKASQEQSAMRAEIERMHGQCKSQKQQVDDGGDVDTHAEFAMPFTAQVRVVTKRIFQQYWRMPSYILSKLLLGTMSGLFIGFTFLRPEHTRAGMRDAVFAVFMVTAVFTVVAQQIQPLFITQRSLYEVRECPNRVYSWKAFLMANIIVEIPYQILTGILTFASLYYPVVGLQDASRQGLILLFFIQLFLYASAFGHMTITAVPDALTAAGLVMLLTLLSVIFSSVMQSRVALPGFWTFMYHASPFTYWISGVVSTMLHGRAIECSAAENLTFKPPPNMTCVDYLIPLADQALGTLLNPMDREVCRYCPFGVADQYLASVDILWEHRWRNFGTVWAYTALDLALAVGAYYLFRVKGKEMQRLVGKLGRW